MWLLILGVPCAAVLALVLWYILVITLYGLFLHYKYRHLPSPPSNLYLGHLQSIQGSELYLKAHEWIQQYGPVFLCWLGQRPLVWVADPAILQQVAVKRFAIFHDRPVLSGIVLPDKAAKSVDSELLLAKNPLWASLRAALQPMFHTSSLQSYEPIINQAAVKLRGYFEQHAVPLDQKVSGSVNAWRALGSLTLDVIGGASMGCNLGALDTLLEGRGNVPYLVAAAEDVFGSAVMGSAALVVQLFGPKKFLYRFFSWFQLRVMKCERSLRAFSGRTRLFAASLSIYRNAMKRHATTGAPVAAPDESWVWWDKNDPVVADNPCKDVIPSPDSLPDLLARARSKGGSGLSEVEVVANIYEMILAGYETTSVTLGFALYLTSLHKDVEKKVLEEVDAFGDKDVTLNDISEGFPFVDAIVRETLRIYPVAPFTNRLSAADCVLGGHYIPKGSSIILALYSVLRNPELFPDPDKFKPDRWMAEGARSSALAQLPFGLGPRNCIGQRLAMEEAKITLIRLYQRLTFDIDYVKHASGLKTQHKLTLQPVEGVHLTPRRRFA